LLTCEGQPLTEQENYYNAIKKIRLLTCVGQSLTEEEAMGMVEEADKDMSGDIDFSEFSHIILSTQ
jgi:Ca2+-binding EF-hand superfamily protein